MSSSERNGTELVYGVRSDMLILMPRQRAEELARVHAAIEESQTWGEFRNAISPEAFEDAMSWYDEDGEPRPGLDEAFDAEMLPGYGDGAYPGWPAQEMLEWMPEEVQRRFGRVQESVHNGPFLEIAPSVQADLIAALEAHGFRCTKDTGLVERAYGD